MAHSLENYFSGDESWRMFVDLYRETWDACDFQTELIEKLNMHIDIAIVIYGKMTQKNRILSWINTAIPALDELSPIDCLETEILLTRLKTMLMRMP